MKNFIKFLLISFLISNNTLAGESLNKKHFYLEIESLLMVMRYEKFKNSSMNKNYQIKYQALPLDKCNCVVKVKKKNKIDLFYTDICNKTIVKKDK